MRSERSIEAAAVARICGTPNRPAAVPGAIGLKTGGNARVSAGWPDRCFVLPGGRVAWVEFKRPGQVPTKLQASRIAALRRVGHAVAVADSVEFAVGFVRDAAGMATPTVSDPRQKDLPL